MLTKTRAVVFKLFNVVWVAYYYTYGCVKQSVSFCGKSVSSCRRAVATYSRQTSKCGVLLSFSNVGLHGAMFVTKLVYSQYDVGWKFRKQKSKFKANKKQKTINLKNVKKVIAFLLLSLKEVQRSQQRNFTFLLKLNLKNSNKPCKKHLANFFLFKILKFLKFSYIFIWNSYTCYSERNSPPPKKKKSYWILYSVLFSSGWGGGNLCRWLSPTWFCSGGYFFHQVGLLHFFFHGR